MSDIEGTGTPAIDVSFRNLSTVVQRKDLKLAFRAFIKQANNDLHLYWNNEKGEPGARFIPLVNQISEVWAGDPWPDDTCWRATILDYPAQAMAVDDLRQMPIDALDSVGYHYYQHDETVPCIVVFAALAQDAGLPWTLTFSHELLEALADPLTRLTLPRKNIDYELEICDPVQYQGYPIEGIWVSNFVTPAWFGVPPAPGNAGDEGESSPTGDGAYDFARQLTSAGERALGGMRTSRPRGGGDRTEELTRMGTVVTLSP
jgi:hypothetical protein